MFKKLASRTSCVPLLCLLLSILAILNGCKNTDDEEHDDTQYIAMSVLVTDSDEWVVQIFKEHLLYSNAVTVKLSAPWSIPTREEASVLRTLTYPYGSERFITTDGYTFRMPSPSVTKAGAKTQYSVLGLWRRKTIIDVPF